MTVGVALPIASKESLNNKILVIMAGDTTSAMFSEKILSVKTSNHSWHKGSHFKIGHTPIMCGREDGRIKDFDMLCNLKHTLWVGNLTYALMRIHSAPNTCRAARNSFTAVSASSKFSAEIAKRACFCAFVIAASSVLSGPLGL